MVVVPAAAAAAEASARGKRKAAGKAARKAALIGVGERIFGVNGAMLE